MPGWIAHAFYVACEAHFGAYRRGDALAGAVLYEPIKERSDARASSRCVSMAMGATLPRSSAVKRLLSRRRGPAQVVVISLSSSSRRAIIRCMWM